MFSYIYKMHEKTWNENSELSLVDTKKQSIKKEDRRKF